MFVQPPWDRPDAKELSKSDGRADGWLMRVHLRDVVPLRQAGT
jgi:hypothetical protein